MRVESGAAKFCLLQTSVDELDLDNHFFSDIKAAVPSLSQNQIAEGVFNGATQRESLNRLLNGSSVSVCSTRVFTLICQIILRDEYKIHLGMKGCRNITESETQALKKVVYEYGISCVSGDCCSVVPKPIFVRDRIYNRF